MGVYANTVSIIQFTVTGDLPKQDQFQWFSEKLAGRGFQWIWKIHTEEFSEGWVQVDSSDDATFEAPSDFWRDNYLVFSLRRDQRKIPTAVLKSHTGREEGTFLAQHPNLRRTPKKKREEIKEQVQLRLMSRCLPVPSTVDIVCDQAGIITLFTLGSKVIERFEDIFRKCFEGFHPVAIHPFARARMLVDGPMLDKLEAANQANSDSVVALIRDNQWLGWDFMVWLLQRGVNGEGDFNVCRPGHLTNGERFSAWIDDRIQLQGGGEEGGIQKVSVSGSQDSYLEAISALKGGKQITSATICMEKDENLWKLTLKGETFGFAGLKCPQVRIEKDATVDQMSEREAAFYERMYLLEQGVQLFDSLFATFLKERLGEGWNARLVAIQEWLEGKK